MAVFGVAPAFVRLSLRLTGADLGAGAAPAAALLRRAGAAATDLSADDPRLTAWREPYFALGIPDDVHTPPEALAHWAALPHGVPSLGPLSDLVNAFSLQVVAPVAAYDLDAATGDLWLRPSRGIELYQPLSGEPPSTPTIGQLLLADSADQVLALHWHGAPGRGTFVTPASRDVLVQLDLLPPLAEQADALGARLARLLTGFLGGTLQSQRLDRATPLATWTA